MSEEIQDWYAQMVRKLQICGKAKRTQDSYTRAVYQLTLHFGKGPEYITEKELEQYFLYRRNESGWAPKTLNICFFGIKFYYEYVLEKEWKLLTIVKAQKEERLPSIPSKEVVHKVLSCVNTFHNFVFFSTVYACGLRLQEALSLQVPDIDGTRLMLHIHRGKGAKDRYVPLPQETLRLMREYWKTHRNPLLLFPALGRGRIDGPTATTPMDRGSVQGALKRAVRKAEVTIPFSVHTLRHAYATHLLEQGLNIRIIQRYMGHRSLETTMRYLHLTQKGKENAYQLIDSFMSGFTYERS